MTAPTAKMPAVHQNAAVLAACRELRLFLDLTTDRGWQPELYEDWLIRMLTANLLAPAHLDFFAGG
jgi:hypothetical protein